MHDRFSLRLPPMADCPSAEDKELIEFMDEAGQLLFIAPYTEAERLGLRHKLVGVALRVGGGRFLVRRNAEGELPAGRLELSGVAHVRPGEARENAALRSLRPLGLDPAPALLRAADFILDSPTPRRHVTVYLALGKRGFAARTVEASPAAAGLHSAPRGSLLQDSRASAFKAQAHRLSDSKPQDEILLLDRDELEGLARHSPELLTAGLLWAIRSGCLWTSSCLVDPISSI